MLKLLVFLVALQVLSIKTESVRNPTKKDLTIAIKPSNSTTIPILKNWTIAGNWSSTWVDPFFPNKTQNKTKPPTTPNPPTPTICPFYSSNHRKIWLIVGIVGGILLLIIIICCCCCCRRRRQRLALQRRQQEQQQQYLQTQPIARNIAPQNNYYALPQAQGQFTVGIPIAIPVTAPPTTQQQQTPQKYIQIQQTQQPQQIQQEPQIGYPQLNFARGQPQVQQQIPQQQIIYQNPQFRSPYIIAQNQFIPPNY